MDDMRRDAPIRLKKRDTRVKTAVRRLIDVTFAVRGF